MDTDRAPHQHVLGTLGDLAIHSQQVGLLKRLEPEEVVIEVAGVIKLRIDLLIVLLHNVVDGVGEERRGPAHLVNELE